MRYLLAPLAVLAACAAPARVTVPDAAAPDAARPDATVPGVTAPDAAAPDVTVPGVTVPDAAAPDVTVPDAATPDVTPTPDVAPAPDVTPTPDVAPAPDVAVIGEPPWVPLDVRTTACPPLVACGGAVSGTWDVAGGCFDLPVPADLMRCPGARVTSTSGRARGRVTFGPVIASRAAEWEVQAEVLIPSYCAAAVGGCAVLQGLARGSFPGAVCTEGPGRDCRCNVRQTGGLRDGDAYTTVNNQIVSASLNRRWDYCVTGARMRYRDVSAAAPREPGTIELLRRSP
jgi:hypothetical protein